MIENIKPVNYMESPVDDAKSFYHNLAPHVAQRESAQQINKLIKYIEYLENRLKYYE